MARDASDLSGPGGAGMEGLRGVAVHGIDPGRYRSYLLRLWREAPGAPWRCHVQCVGTGRERRFAGLAEMIEFLVADAAGGSEGGDANAKSWTRPEKTRDRKEERTK